MWQTGYARRAPEDVGQGQDDIGEEKEQDGRRRWPFVLREGGGGQGDGETRMASRGGKGQGAAVSRIGAAQKMANEQAEQNDGGCDQKDAVANLRGDRRRLREQGDGAARHQQHEGGAAQPA